jgi:hypothetical protein
MYAKTQAEGGPEGGPEGGDSQSSDQPPEGNENPTDDDVVDAEFEDISKK